MVVSVAVLLASATWFSGTAAAGELARAWTLDAGSAAWLTNATQYGFIAGTLVYALLNMADRFNPRRVFFASAAAGAAFNLGFAWLAEDLSTALPFRFLTGVTLAGVYPVGMKIVASWFRDGLGWRLGVMVGCLTLGTAFPYGVAAAGMTLDWRALASIASAVAVVGGVLMLVGVDDGPHSSRRARLDLRMVAKVFAHPPFRHTALGYFGHMWELYALWALSGFWLAESLGPASAVAHVQLLAFAIVGVGSLGCIGGGLVSRRAGARRVAIMALAVSATMCGLSGLVHGLPPVLLLLFVLVWGLFAVADSPQFSALAARHAPAEYIGTALTIQNGLGFLVSTLSIQLLPPLAERVGWRWALSALALGPLFGLVFTLRVPEEPTADANRTGDSDGA